MNVAPSGVFVYGSLKRGESNELLMRHASSRVEASASGTLYNRRNGFPGMTLEGNDTIHGEYVTFSDMAQALPRLDKLESYDPLAAQHHHYQRVTIQVHCADGQDQQAWAYVMSPQKVTQQGGQRLPDGVWHGSRLQRAVFRPLRRLEAAWQDWRSKA
jgi:gamma-glutamylcyclotransferase (GGCT)/AIG2-like uncharacterized protein YtfP